MIQGNRNKNKPRHRQNGFDPIEPLSCALVLRKNLGKNLT